MIVYKCFNLHSSLVVLLIFDQLLSSYIFASTAHPSFPTNLKKRY